MHSLENLVAVMKWNSYIKLRRIVRPRALIGNNKHACLSIDVFSQHTGFWMAMPALQIIYCDGDTDCINPAGFRLLWVWLQNAHYIQPTRIVAFYFPVLFLLSTRFDLRKSTGARKMLQIQHLEKIYLQHTLLRKEFSCLPDRIMIPKPIEEWKYQTGRH